MRCSAERKTERCDDFGTTKHASGMESCPWSPGVFASDLEGHQCLP
jgi:hypothetical protein